MRIAFGIALLVGLAALAVAGTWVWVASDVGAGYAAKVTCSLVFNSGQDPGRVLERYVLPEVAPLGAALDVRVTDGAVEARTLGLRRARAVHRRGLGCTLLPGGESVGTVELPPRAPRVPWGDPVEPPPLAVEAAIERAFQEPGPGSGVVRNTTAVVVLHDGRLVAERYAPGYGPDVPMLSWSMAKSVLGTLVGVAVAEGRLALHEPAPVPEWRTPGDPRGAITLDQLLRMSSGLAFDETYGPANDVSRMLFTRPDTGAFAAGFPLEAPPDTRWSYSSGTSNILARILRDSFGGDLGTMVRWSRERLFAPAGMTSAFLEPDASGSFIGSSFTFMTARDWARFGELHRRDGVWEGRRVLPEGWVAYVTRPTPTAPEARYGAHWWLWPRELGAYAARGHSGQYTVVVPSARLVVVRLGLSLGDELQHGAHELVTELVRHYASHREGP